MHLPLLTPGIFQFLPCPTLLLWQHREEVREQKNSQKDGLQIRGLSAGGKVSPSVRHGAEGILPDREGHSLREPQATWTWQHQKGSNHLQSTPSVRPHFLREQRLLRDYFSVGREYSFFRNLLLQLCTFRLVLHSPSKNVSLQPEVLCLTSLPISQAGKGTAQAVSVPVPAWGGSLSPAGAPAQLASGLPSTTGLSPPGERCKWKSDHCQAA